MSASFDQAVPQTLGKTGARGRWLVALGVAVSGAAVVASICLRKYLPLIAEDNFVRDPLWHSIRRDALDGMCHLVALLICLSVAFVARKQYPLYANMMAGQSVLFNGGYVWVAAWILLNTSGLMTAGATTSRWPTIDSYIDDPAKWIGIALAMALALLIAVIGFIHHRRSIGSSALGGRTL